MAGDQADLVMRLRTVLPQSWFADATPVLDGLLGGLGAAWGGLYGLLRTVQAQTRIRTASGGFLDMIADDFFGSAFLRGTDEEDVPFEGRILQNLLRPRGTRQAVSQILGQLTGRQPVIFEPALSSDTGGYSTDALGYGVAGAYGSLSLPYQCFVTAYRPLGVGIPLVGGYGTSGPLVYANLAWIGTHVTDADILEAIVSVLPASTTAWTRII